jgi:Family of unknown function (DUF6515)
MHRIRLPSLLFALTVVGVIIWTDAAAGQVRGARRTATVHGEEGRAAAAGPRGVAVKGEEGYAAASRRGAVVKGDEGYAAVGRHGAVAQGEDGYARVGPRGAVVAGEEGYAAVGRAGVVVGNRYESYEAWRVVAGVGTAIAIGTMLARPPTAAVTVSVGGASYWYENGAYYTRVMSNGAMVYQVVAPPAGAIIATLPSGCRSVRVNNLAYSQCGPTYYQRVSTGYRVVVL